MERDGSCKASSRPALWGILTTCRILQRPHLQTFAGSAMCWLSQGVSQGYISPVPTALTAGERLALTYLSGSCGTAFRVGLLQLLLEHRAASQAYVSLLPFNVWTFAHLQFCA
jgi:hypothetical protein